MLNQWLLQLYKKYKASFTSFLFYNKIMKRGLRKEYWVKRESVLDKDKKDKIIYEKVINN